MAGKQLRHALQRILRGTDVELDVGFRRLRLGWRGG